VHERGPLAAGASSGHAVTPAVLGAAPGRMAIALAGFSAFVDLYATQGLLPLLSRTFHAAPGDVSATVSATTSAVALGALFVGPCADLVGRKSVIVGAAFAISLPTFLAASAGSLQALCVWRFLQGLCMPAIFAVTIAYVSEEWAGVGVGRAMAAYVSGTVAGGVTGRFLAGLIADRYGWQGSFVVLGGVNLVVAAALARYLPPSRRFVPERNVLASLAGLSSHLKNPALWAAYAVGFNVLFSNVAAFTYVSFYLAAPPFSLGTVALGSVFFVYLAGLVVTPLGGRALDRFGYRAVFAVAIGMASLGVLLTLVAQLAVILTGLALCASGIFVCQSAATSYVGGTAGRARSSAIGLYVACYYAGGTVGALAPALAWHAAGWPGCVACIVGVQLATAGIALRFWRPELGRRQGA
jgi:MFS transporter, YNFM family, putative membrane transport protein